MKIDRINITSTIHTLLRDEKAFVFYKKPNATKVRLITQRNTQLYTTSFYGESGFVFAPFDNNKETILFPDSQSEFSVYQLPKKKEVVLKTNKIDSEEKEKYIALLEKTIAFIKVGKADKIVLSRVLNKSYKKEAIGVIYESLLQAYPTAFVYIWSHPKVGLWIGATPEKLIEINKNSFRTMSLAGTQLYTESIHWKTKELEEQQWVTAYIQNQLKPIVTALEITEPFTKKAGHLAHICSEIRGELSSGFALEDLIVSLHPTPAVCGVPKTIATEFILKNEGYNRTFYTGFLGEINSQKKTDLYVNLRCMQLKKGYAKIYVGGGITKDSIPVKEWEETVAKSEVLGRFL